MLIFLFFYVHKIALGNSMSITSHSPPNIRLVPRGEASQVGIEKEK